ncbi:MAG: ArsR/SmtB family transcription factor [Bacilli bacterium]
MIDKINEDLLTEMSQLLQIAADETRLKILLCLFEGEKCVSDIQFEINASQSLVSHQLKILKKAKLVSFRKEKNYVFYFLDDEHVQLLISVAYQHAKEKLKDEED